jgi:hypothetical protein
MAITTADQVLIGMQPARFFHKWPTSYVPEATNVPQSLFYAPGFPGAGATPAAGMAGEAITSLGGCIQPGNPVSGNQYLAQAYCASAAGIGTILICDRLWQNSGIAVTTTTSQTINSVAWPARDINGSTNGEGVYIGIEVRTATTNGSAVGTSTMSYTNSDGTAGRTATLGISFPATSTAGTFIIFALQAGDKGVRSVQSITLATSYGGGAIHLVAFRILSFVGMNGTTMGIPAFADFTQIGLPRVYDNTNIFLVNISSGTTITQTMGQLTFTRG